ncbi:alpha-L-rhamnosidase [Pseudobutyrivibrio sp. MD2005]|uniref:alpha-L-rhamnosidase n=1 Tax=Pseudobutyrivibrio sp. MD2005 TaxID=1410616 RepID=UPI0004864B67|nr:alpha-L-rhamnosidase [Pseudobutyrivibrio sp. MD2005]
MRITRTKINGIENPIGYDFKTVIASWNVEDTEAKHLKSGILEVADDIAFTNILYKKENDSLDQTGEQIGITLKPRTRYYWRVTITGDNGDSATSDIQYFETGKMDEPWVGKWIAAEEGAKFHPLFSKELNLKDGIKSARLYVSCLGVFEAYIDDKKVGNEILTPYINDYETGMQIITFDVTKQLKADSKLSIQVARGWYMSNFGLEGGYNFGDRMEAIAELHVDYEDGSSQVIGTDSSWKVAASDVIESGIYYGEDLDRTAGIIEKGNAVEVEGERGLLDRYSIPVIVKEVLTAKEIIKTPAGETVIDFGQNHAGVMEFDADFPSGTVITIDCGEILQQGNFYNENYREARARFVYTSDGRKETVCPTFTFFGYRYIRIQGWPDNVPLTLAKVRSNVIYSDMERTGFISTSNEKINRLYENCIWGQKSNFLDMPTDCPQRNERLGWTGDAQVFSQTASYNMDTRAFYKKFLRDLNYDAKRHDGAVASYLPSTAGKNLAGTGSIWGDVGTFVPNVVFNTFGSLEDVREHYELMKNWIEYMHRNDMEHGDKGTFTLPFQFGDWLGLDGITEQSFKGGTNDDYLAAVYYYRSTVITSEMAERLGENEDAAKYKKLAAKIKDGILQEYFSPTGRLACDTQAAYIVALAFDIYVDREKLIEQFVDRLNRDCFQIKCGFVGAPLLCTTLAKCGRMDLAYHFLFNEGFPSWLYCVNLGATTIWERWNSVLEDGTISGTGMNSLNHYSYGTIVQFMYEYIGGITPAEPGFKVANICPQPAMRFRHFNSCMTTASGKFVSNWKIADDGIITLEIQVPFNAKANVTLPRFSREQLNVKGCDAKVIGDDGRAVLEAGSYEFSYMPSKDYRSIYGPLTRLSELKNDSEIMAILKEKLPSVFGIIMSGDKEMGNHTLAELPYLFFLGVSPDEVNPVNEMIYAAKRW